MDSAPQRIAIIGAGPGGLCAAKRLLDEGLTDFTIFEQSDGVGGTWRRNQYPGCECDVPSALYSFSFEFKADWSKPYGTQPEILAYMEAIAVKYGVLAHCRFNNGVVSARWDGNTSMWTLELQSGERVTANVVISALGMFNELAWPGIDGLDTFEGAMWHSAQWNWTHNLRNQRVAVIGSAASAVQFVPEIVKQAAHIDYFQRTANWVLPKLDTPYTEEQLAAFRADPAPLLKFRDLVEQNMNQGMTFADQQMLAEREAVGRDHIEQVHNPVAREQLQPTHPYGCKRPLFSNAYYPAFNRPNLELITTTIARVERDGIVTADGKLHEADVIVIATGFATTKYLSAIDVVGTDGQALVDAWTDGPLAHLGISVAGFPNLYMLYGPNTNNGSILTMLEYQVDHIIAHLDWMIADKLASIDVTNEALSAYNDDLQRAIANVSVWQADCTSYYRAPSGRVVTQWPFSMTEFRDRTQHIVHADYVTTQR